MYIQWLMDTLDLITPRLLARLRAGNHLSLADLPAEQVSQAQAELDEEVTGQRLISRRPEPDMAVFDPGPYYLALRDGRPPISANQPLNRKIAFRHYLASLLLTHWFEQDLDENNGQFSSDVLPVGQPYILKSDDEDDTDPPQLNADWFYAEPVTEGGVVLCFLEHRGWKYERIFEYLESLDRFLKASAQTGYDYPRYANAHWLNGHVVLVHTAPNEESPAALALAAATWRTALQGFEVENGYRPAVSIGHANRLLRCRRFDNVIAYAYDLAGYC